MTIDPATEALAAPIESLGAWLAEVRNPDGSWGYLAGEAGRPESTVLAAAAGAGLAQEGRAAQAPAWGMWLLPAVAYPTHPALCAPVIAALIEAHSSLNPSDKWTDGTIVGWSWVPGTYGWVEPTAYAMISLRRAAAAPERVEEGRRLLLDRQCDDGGWNYGNPEMLDSPLPGDPTCTAWALMALTAGPEVARGLEFLEEAIRAPSTLRLALAALAAEAHGHSGLPWALPLAARLASAPPRDRIDLAAIALAALRTVSGQAHPFV